MGVLREIVFAAACAAALPVACAALYGEDGPDPPPPDVDAGVPDDAEAVDDANDETILPVDDDGGLVLDAGPDASACNGTQVFIPASGATGTACNPNSVLLGLPPAAGLEYGCTNAKGGSLGGVNITSCIGVTFAKSLAAIVVRAGSTGKACDTGCNAAGGYCGTGDKAYVFASAGGAFVYAGTLSLTNVQSDFAVPVPASLVGANQVAVCRGPFACQRDDVLVASIRGTCKD